MKTWTLEKLTELWIDRGYSRKAAQARAKIEYDEMNRKKSDSEKHEIAQEMLYN